MSNELIHVSNECMDTYKLIESGMTYVDAGDSSGISGVAAKSRWLTVKAAINNPGEPRNIGRAIELVRLNGYKVEKLSMVRDYANDLNK